MLCATVGRIVANSHKNEIKIIEFERALGWRLRRAELLLRYSGLLSSYMGDDIYSAACIVDTAAAKERERERGREAYFERPKCK